MNAIWMAVLATALVLGFALRRFLTSRAAVARGDIDFGSVSQSWLTEQRAGSQEDRFS